MTGNPRWNVSLGAAVASSPTVTDGLIIVGAEDGVHARSTRDGEPTWFTSTPDPVLGSVAASGDVAFAATAAGSVMALDTRTGATRWTREVGGLVDTSVAAGSGSVVVGTTTGVVVALDPGTGAEQWRLETGDLARVGTPAIADGRVYIATLDGDPAGAHHLFALDLSTGAVIWRMPSPGGEAAYTPVVMDGHVITEGEDGHVTALDPASGLPLWQVEAPGPIEIVPAMVDGTVYGASNGGFAFALDAETATELWRVPIKGTPYGTGVVAGFVLVGTDIGDLYAIGGTNPDFRANLRRRRHISIPTPSQADQVEERPDAYHDAGHRHGHRRPGGRVREQFLGHRADGRTFGRRTYQPDGRGRRLADASGLEACRNVATQRGTGLGADRRPTRPRLDGQWSDRGHHQHGRVSRGSDDRQPLGRGALREPLLDLLAEGKYLESWGKGGSARGELDLSDHRPNPDGWGGIAFAPDGSFFIADTGNHRVQHFDKKRVAVNEWGTFGTDDGQFAQIISIATDGKTVYVGDGSRTNIQAFTADGDFIREFDAEGGFYRVALGSDGRLRATNGERETGAPLTFAIFQPDGT